MSEEWLFFPCNMDGKTAFIFFDNGISDTIDETAPPLLLCARLNFKQLADDGLPTRDEFDALTAVEDDLQKLVDEHGAMYVGRVTVDGHRNFHVFTKEDAKAWEPRLKALGQRHGYPLSFTVEADPERKGYWKHLYPTPDDWQVIQDQQVLDVLSQHGDDGSESRLVEHWAYFPTEPEARRFCDWLKDNGYALVAMEPDEDDQISVNFSHESAVTLPVITSHTIELRQRASEFGGDYDGWEAIVCEEEE